MTVLKLCGNHSYSDFELVSQSNAEFIGVIFAESKRKVEPKELSNWLATIELKRHQKLVGVFVNPSIQEIEAVLSHVQLDVIQLHGNESKERIRLIKNHFNLPIFKAIHHEPPTSLKLMEELSSYVDGIIVDSKVRGAWGGTGITFDWEALPEYISKAKMLNVRCFIAGGITPDNVIDCLNYKPEAIDISSGIERNGKKDRMLLSRLEERMKDNE